MVHSLHAITFYKPLWYITSRAGWMVPPGPEIISRLKNDEDVLATSCGHTLYVSWDNHIHDTYFNGFVEHES